MLEQVWETFDAIYKSVHRQGRRIEELENRCTELERRLREVETSKADVLPFPVKTEGELVEVGG